MNFDVNAMKKRANSLMGIVKPNPILGGVIITVFSIFLYVIMTFVASYVDMSGNKDSIEGIMYIFWMVYLLFYAFFMTSLKWFSLKATREEETVNSDFFLSFKEKQWKVLALAIIKGLCIFIMMFFFFVGGLLPFYCFRFAEYIIKDDSTISPIKAMGKSMAYMKGHYGELIKIDLSLLGWWALYFFTSGLAGIYVLPYTSLLYAEFYDYIKGQYETFYS